MTNKKVTRRALLASVLALSVSATMLIGTSYAWFTDSVSSTGNVIKTGTLNIDLGIKTKNDNDYVSTKTTNKVAFNYDKWEPGYTEWVNAKVSTNGTLALKYTMAITANGEVSELADVIDVYYKAEEVERSNNRAQDLAKLTKIGTLRDAINGTVMIDDTLIPGSDTEDFATIALHMQETAGNDYQDKSIGSDFSLQILATQYTYETDSFDNKYDENADGTPDNAGWPYDLVGTATVTDAAQPLTVTAGNVAVTVPADVLTVGDKYELLVNNVNVVTSGVETTVDMDITLKKNGAVVSAQTGVNYTAAITLGSGLNITSVTHNGTALADTDYSYTGDTLTITTPSFSPFQIVYTRGEVEQKAINAVNEAIATLPDDNKAAVEEALEKASGDNVAPAVAAITAAIDNNNQEVLDVLVDALNNADENNNKAKFMQSVADSFAAGKTLTVADTAAEIKTALASGSETVAVVIPASTSTYEIAGTVIKNNSSIIGDGDTTIKLTDRASAENVSIENIKFVNSGSALSFTGNGTFENCTFTGNNGTYYCYGKNGKEVKFVDCTIYGAVYGTHFDAGNGYVSYENCDLTGWNSFGSTITSVSFTNCRFHKSDYGSIRFYQTGSITNCTFDDDFVFLDVAVDNVTVTITNSNIPLSKIRTNKQNVKWIINGVETAIS